MRMIMITRHCIQHIDHCMTTRQTGQWNPGNGIVDTDTDYGRQWHLSLGMLPLQDIPGNKCKSPYPMCFITKSYIWGKLCFIKLQSVFHNVFKQIQTCKSTYVINLHNILKALTLKYYKIMS